MIMFADQIHMAAVVTVLSRPQIAILDFDEESAYNFGGERCDYGLLAHEAQEGMRQ